MDMSKLLPIHLTHIRAAGYTAATIRDRKRLLAIADTQLPGGIDTPTTEELATFLAHDGWSPATRRTYYSHLRSFYRWACASKPAYLDWDPSSALTPPRDPTGVPHPVTDSELRDALARSSGHWRLVITLAAYAGLRRADICHLRREDVTADTIRIERGKGGKSAVLPTHPEIWRLVEPMPPGRLVRAADHNMSRYARRHFDAIGMPEVHLHRFRHYFATALLRGGADVRVVQSLMRHSSLQTTARYLDIADGQRRLAISTLPVLSSPLQDAALSQRVDPRVA